MSPMEIIFVLLGVGILIASCFVGKKEQLKTQENPGSEEIIEAQKQEIKKYAEHILEEKSEEYIVKTDDYLSKVSNEKIMSVNEFSSQIFEKIDANHKEVVFLYDMLNQKEDELKQEVQKFDAEKLEMQKATEQIIRLTKQMKQSATKTDSQKAVTAEKNKKTELKKEAGKSVGGKPVQGQKRPEIPVTQSAPDGQMEFTDMMQADQQQKEVLMLHKQGKSILDISRALGMGQGEVKLIIGLYGE